GDGQPEVLEGGDSSVLHAFTSGGGQASGFPKFQSGWIVYAPTPRDIDSDGKTEVIANTREGYLNVWDTNGTAAGNHEWWNARQDERNTGMHGVDTRPPGLLRNASFNPGTSTLGWTAPGDDWYAGTPDHYDLRTSSSPITPDNFGQATA